MWFGLVERISSKGQGIWFLPALKAEPSSPQTNLKLGIEAATEFGGVGGRLGLLAYCAKDHFHPLLNTQKNPRAFKRDPHRKFVVVSVVHYARALKRKAKFGIHK